MFFKHKATNFVQHLNKNDFGPYRQIGKLQVIIVNFNSEECHCKVINLEKTIIILLTEFETNIYHQKNLDNLKSP